MKTKIPIFLIIILLIGCKSNDDKVIAFLIDISGSTINLRSKYVVEFDKIINNAYKVDNNSLSFLFGKKNSIPTVLFYTISDNPYYQDNIKTFCFKAPKFDFEDAFSLNYTQFNDTLKKLKGAIIQAGHEIIYSKPTSQTDIYTPLYLLANELSHINVKKKVIYIFSDLIDNQGKNKKICDLKGIEVYVLLAYDRRLNMRQKQIDKIKKEFLEYLNQCKAVVSLSHFKTSF